MSNGEPVPASEARPLPQNGTPASGAGRRESLFRVIILLAVVGSVAVILWSLFGLLFPQLKQSRELSSTVARLSTEVDGLEREWTEAEAAQVRNRRRQVDFELFGGKAALEAWLAQLKEQGAPLGLGVRGDFGPVKTRLAGSHMLTIIPVMVSVEVQPTPPDATVLSPYQRILQLSQRLTGGEKRADLTELTVVAGTNSIRRAVLQLNYWVDEERKP